MTDKLNPEDRNINIISGSRLAKKADVSLRRDT